MSSISREICRGWKQNPDEVQGRKHEWLKSHFLRPRLAGMKIIGVIPSRYGSTRLKAKPLAPICGKPLVQWVWEAANRASVLNEVIVATDDQRIADVVKTFGGVAVMTPPECPSGTDRVHAAIAGRDCDIAVNIQGDEPLMTPDNIERCVNAMIDDPKADVSTPMIPIANEEDFAAVHVVKVVTDSRGYALYFSRSMLPNMERVEPGERPRTLPLAMKHLGLYVYRRAALDAFVAMPPSRYEQIEKLEQLRFLEAGYKIRLVQVEHDSIGVDTMQDVISVERLMKAK